MIQCREENGRLVIFLTGTIDSSNAASVEDEIRKCCEQYPQMPLNLDCDQLAYTTSAGLRVILRIKQGVDDTVLTNVHSAVYDVLDITGFSGILNLV